MIQKQQNAEYFEILKARPYWTAEEFGAIHSIAPLTARRLAYSGQAESIKIGRSLRFKNNLNQAH